MCIRHVNNTKLSPASCEQSAHTGYFEHMCINTIQHKLKEHIAEYGQNLI